MPFRDIKPFHHFRIATDNGISLTLEKFEPFPARYVEKSPRNPDLPKHVIPEEVSRATSYNALYRDRKGNVYYFCLPDGMLVDYLPGYR